MGKKAKFKALRRMATEMPVIMQHHIQGERLTGQELISEGVKTVGKEEKPIEPKGEYIRKKVVQAPINHARQLKNAYYRGGAMGVKHYQDQVDLYIALQKQRAASVKEKQTAPE